MGEVESKPETDYWEQVKLDRKKAKQYRADGHFTECALVHGYFELGCTCHDWHPDE